MELYDIVIIGGSVAGLAASQDTEYKTLVIEKKKEIGRPVVCGEYVPLPFVYYARVPSSVVAKKISGMVTHFNGERIENRWPGVILNRDCWESSLYKKAKAREVEFWFCTKVIEVKADSILLERKGDRFEIKAGFIIGADGPRSVTGRGIKSQNQKFIYGYQYRVPLKEGLEHTEVYIDKEIREGYGWLFPKEKTANVGVGLRGVRFPKMVLDRFLDRLYKAGKIEKEILARVAGPIPVGGVLDRLGCKNTVLVGDAAGFTNPITGAGIYQAFFTGRLAAKAANSYLTGDKNAARAYEEEAKRFWESQLRRDKGKREALAQGWPCGTRLVSRRDIPRGWDGDFKTIIHKSWIAFDEYYEDKAAL